MAKIHLPALISGAIGVVLHKEYEAEKARVEDYFATADDFNEWLAAAEVAASSAKQREFVDGIYTAFEEWGMRSYLSYAQYRWLVDLVNK